MLCGIASGGAGHIAHIAQRTRHHGQRGLLHHPDRNIDLIAQVVGTVFKQYVQHDARVQLLELDQPRAHHHLPIAAGHADTYAPAQFLPQAGDGLACSQHFVVDVAAMLVQAQPHLGGLYAPGGALDQLHAHLLFQLGQVVAHVGARHLELACRLAEVAAVNDFHQQGQRLQVHLGFSLVIVQSYLTLCQFMQRL